MPECQSARVQDRNGDKCKTAMVTSARPREYKTQDCKTARLQDCKTARLQDCKITKLQACKTTSLQNHKPAKPQAGKTARLHGRTAGCKVRDRKVARPRGSSEW